MIGEIALQIVDFDPGGDYVPIEGVSHSVLVKNLASGVMDGLVIGTNGDDRLRNEGLIDGTVYLDQTIYWREKFDYVVAPTTESSDDVYRGINDGYVTGVVKGGYGNDTLVGGSQSDRFYGEQDNDLLIGRGGDDTLSGGAGADDLRGGMGDDLLLGGVRADTLRGGSGNDTLDGGRGNDLLIGDGWADTFVFGALSGTDTVADFDQGKDILQLNAHAGGFDALTITPEADNLVITHDSGVVIIAGGAGLVLTADDFLFA